MIELHPEFIKYWYKKGYLINTNPLTEQWHAISIDKNRSSFLVAYYNFFHKKIFYHLYNYKQNELPEKEMLPYVRLQAFL